MDFTYKGYGKLLEKLRENRYETASYFDWKEKPRCVILRHDIDYDIQKAVELARFENKRKVKAAYFVLLTSDFYNVFSKESSEGLKQILNYGHTIGLHFDETRYPEIAGDMESVSQKITEEAGILGTVIDRGGGISGIHAQARQGSVRCRYSDTGNGEQL